jgi:hypothetical protein
MNRAAEYVRELREEQKRIIPPLGGFSLLDAVSIFAPLPEPDYLVHGLIRRGSVVLLGGYGSSGKTWIAIDLLLAVGLGCPWLGRFDTKLGRATFLDYESGTYELRRRLDRCARGRGATEPEKALISIGCMPDVYMGQGDFEYRIAALAAERDLIVIDSLLAASPGVQENESTMRMGLDVLRRVAEQTSCTFVVLAHAKKTSGSATKLDPREILRGSSAIFDAADGAFVATWSTDKVRVEHVKSRHGKATAPFDVTMTDTPLGTGVIVVAGDATDESPRESAAEAFRRCCNSAYEVIAKNPGCSKRFVRSHCIGFGVTRVDAALEEMVRQGRVVNSGSEGKGKFAVADFSMGATATEDPP